MAVTGGIVEAYGETPGAITCAVAAAVTEGRWVEAVVGGTRRVQHAGAGSLLVLGLAQQTASAAEDEIGVCYSGFFYLVASGAIANGDYIKSGAAGVSVAHAADGDPRLIVGRAWSAAADTALFLCEVL